MKEQLISFETAVLAKEKGFNLKKENEPIFEIYNENGELEYDSGEFGSNYDFVIYAPTQALLQKWLREKHGTFVSVSTYNYESPGNFYFLPIINFQRGHEKLHTSFSKDFLKEQEYKIYNSLGEDVKTTFMENAYEEAFEKGLFKALELIK